MWRHSRVLAVSGAFALGLLLVSGGQLRAQEEGETILPDPDNPNTRVGTRGATFLAIGVGARANALAGAGTVLTEGVHALYWNVAAAASTEGFNFGFSYADLYGGSGIEHFYVAGMLPILGGVFGVSVNQLTSGDIPRTTAERPSGDDPTVGSTFDWSSSAVGGHYARLITDRLALGATVKFIQEGIDNARADWVALDVGVKFATGLLGTTVAATVANLGGRAQMRGSLIEEIAESGLEVFETDRDITVELQTNDIELPTVFRFGIRTDLTGTPEALLSTQPEHKVVALGEFRDAVDTDIETVIAFEYSYRDLFFVRGGKRWFNESFAQRDFDDGLSGGLGILIPALGRRLALDYAYTSLGQLDNTQIFSVEFGF